MTANRQTPLLFRPARSSDSDSLYDMALTAGVGMTNLPQDRAMLTAMAEASEAALTAASPPAGARFWFVLLDGETVVGTALIISAVGLDWPFYSFRRNRIANVSLALGRSTTLEMLTLSNDYNGAVEVGGLIVSPTLRGTGAGPIAARARYLFLGLHREWFGPRVMAELRGWLRPDGTSPVWDTLGQPFYGMDFAAADALSGTAGNQFIAELGPRHPIYADMLGIEAREALGKPHDQSAPAYRLLRHEGFSENGYIDVFDGGPQLDAEIDRLAAVLEMRTHTLLDGMPEGEARLMLVSAGRGIDFRTICTPCDISASGVRIDAVAAQTLAVTPGEQLTVTPHPSPFATKGLRA